MSQSKRTFHEIRELHSNNENRRSYENELNEEFNTLKPRQKFITKKELYKYSKPFIVTGYLKDISEKSIVIEFDEHHKDGIFAQKGGYMKIHFDLAHSFRLHNHRLKDHVEIKVVRQSPVTNPKEYKFLLNDIKLK